MKPLTLENYTELQPYIALADYNEYNSNIVTMLMWNNRYETYFETFDTYALVYNKMPHREPIWLMPYTDEAHRKEAVEKIKERSELDGISFEIHSMTKAFKNWLQDTYPNEFLIWDCYDARDYVYDRKQQETLAGKKMQKRRNHFHAFEKQYEGRFVYRTMSKEDIPNVYAFLQYWKQQKESDDSIDAEEAGIHLLLDHLDMLPIRGGCIYIDGKLEAFNITSMISHDTVQIHVEKANKELRGCYIAILKLFLETLPAEVCYVNREDDMGLSELRKAKTDMQPIFKINKFGCCYEPLTIQQAQQEQLPAIKELWRSSFEEETEASTAYFFDHLYEAQHTWTLSCEDGLLSMAQVRSFQIQLDGQTLEVPFLFGVATDEDYRGVGYMRTLIQHIMAHSKADYLFVQAYDWDVYRSLGFREAYYLAKTKIRKDAYTLVEGCFHEASPTELLPLYEAFVTDKNGYRIRDLAYFTSMQAYHDTWNQTYQVFTLEGRNQGYVLLEKQEDQLIVKELVYESLRALQAMLSLLSTHEQSLYVMSDLDTQLEGRRKEVLCMMVYSKAAQTFSASHLYLQEEL